MLCAMLASHPAILCHHEVFNPKGIRLDLRLRNGSFSLGTLEERTRDPEGFLERLWTHRLDFPCVGFKLTHRQHEIIYRRLLSDPTIGKIVLRRESQLKTYVSRRISETLSEWEVYREEDLIRDRPRVRVEPESFMEHVAFNTEYYGDLRRTLVAGSHAWIEVRYESLLAREEQNRILDFLDVGRLACGLRPGSVKQNSPFLKDLIENYDELRELWRGTPLEAELCQ
jgi:hypothetical protein